MMLPVISKRKSLIFLLSIVAFLVAFFKPFGLSPDYLQYDLFFDDLRQSFSDVVSTSRFEPAFLFAAGFFVSFISSNAFVYALFVFLSIWVKLSFGFKDAVGVYFWVAIAFYFFKYFPLHELNQLRAGLGVSAAMAAFFFVEHQRFRIAVLISCLGVLFHYSVLLILPFLFFNKLSRKNAILFTLIIYGVCAIFVASLQKFAAQYFSVFELYEAASDSGKTFNKFSPVFFPEFFLIAFSIYWWRDLTATMQRVSFLQMIGFALLYAFSDIGVVAVRAHELFSVLWVFYVAQVQYVNLKLRIISYFFIGSSIAISVYLFFSGDFFDSSYV